jgi:hypothetical protein
MSILSLRVQTIMHLCQAACPRCRRTSASYISLHYMLCYRTMAPLRSLHKHAIWLTTQQTLHQGFALSLTAYTCDTLVIACGTSVMALMKTRVGKIGPKAALSLFL